MKKFFKFGCLGFIAIIAVIILIAVFAGGGSEETNDSGGSNKTASKEAAKVKHKVGQDVSVGKFSYRVDAVNESKEITAEYMDTVSTEGKFIIVDIAVLNNDSKARLVDNEMFRIIGEDGTEFSPKDDVDFNLNSENTLFLAEVNPKMTKKAKIAFELPEEEQHYTLQVSSGLGWSGGKYENITLK